jgi:demethylmenaquinone methyltransferase/2-methoxy-6-polyprenyl-1,4-benzoquinol methylase
MNPHAATQAALWGADPQGWAAHSRRILLPLYEEAVRRLAPAPGERLLDAGCGAGLLAVMAARRGATVTGLDVSEELVRDAAARGGGPEYVVGDLESLPLPDAHYDAVAALNSVPYARDAGAALAELARVTKPGGRLLVCEFGRPTWAPFRAAYYLGLERVLPAVAERVSSNPEAYRYLGESIRDWPAQPELAARIAAAGWTRVGWRNLAGGAVALHRARRP